MFLWPVRVYYEDTDSGGVVYHANYMKFMERARTEWLRSHGFEQDELARRDGVIFAVHRASLAFLRPARFNDRLQVSVCLAGHGAASLDFIQEVRPQAGAGTRGEGAGVYCRGEVGVACLDAATLRPRRIPPCLRKILRDR
ncbi:MAG TPA: tol-pal system-associated acyl-CoA thioesterase [Gammaproteobacteria bacterium]|nr:tol-pal system-associated acyl-CoA thioesterase [Gammaproteobacteria bacterium]